MGTCYVMYVLYVLCSLCVCVAVEKKKIYVDGNRAEGLSAQHMFVHGSEHCKL